MAYLPTTVLGLVLPDPSTIQQFETPVVNGDFLALQTAILAVQPALQRFYFTEQTSDGGGVVGVGTPINGTARTVTVPTGKNNAMLRIDAYMYAWANSTSQTTAGNVVVIIDGVPYPQQARLYSPSRQSALTPSPHWDIPLAPGNHTIQVQVNVDAGSAAIELRAFRNTIAVEW